MGLLDMTPDQSGMLLNLGQGLLAASGPSRMPVSFGQALASGIGQMQRGRREDLQTQIQSGHLQMQQAQMEEAKRALAMRAALGQALQDVEFPSAQNQQIGVSGDGGSSSGRQPQGGSQPAFSMADKLMAAAQKAGDYQAYQEAAKLKMDEKKLLPKFSTDFRVGMGADGKPANFVLGDDGSYKQLPMGVAEKLHFANTGGSTVGLDQYTGAPIASTANTQSPDSRASVSATLRGQNLVDARSRESTATTASAGRVPAGYRTTSDGNLEAIPGGPADAKAQALSQQRLTGVTDVDLAIGTLREAYDRLEKGGGITSTKNSAIKNMAASTSASGVGQVVGKVIGTDNQSARNDIAMTRPALLGALMKATGMSAKQMDSNAELKLWMTTATDPALDVESNRRALDKIERKYLGSNSSPSIPANTGVDGGKLAKTVVSRGTYNGKPVVKYSDGSVDYAN